MKAAFCCHWLYMEACLLLESELFIRGASYSQVVLRQIFDNWQGFAVRRRTNSKALGLAARLGIIDETGL